MSIRVKVVIEIYEDAYKYCLLTKDEDKNDMGFFTSHILEAVANGTHLSEIRAEVKEKCNGINEMVEGELSYPLHRGIQSLLCDILDTFDKHIGKET